MEMVIYIVDQVTYKLHGKYTTMSLLAKWNRKQIAEKKMVEAYLMQ